ncbi:MAG: hypothetical protein MJ237_08540 [bacterium]|nr:hypothetical protein [bacterium]
MEVQEIVNLIMNSGVTIVVLAYFMVRDWKFSDNLKNTLSKLSDQMELIKDLLRKE